MLDDHDVYIFHWFTSTYLKVLCLKSWLTYVIHHIIESRIEPHIEHLKLSTVGSLGWELAANMFKLIFENAQ